MNAKKIPEKKIKKTRAKKTSFFSRAKNEVFSRTVISVQRKKIIWFAVKFFAIFFALHAIIVSAELTLLNQLIAGISASSLGLMHSGNMILTGSGVFFITNSCTGLVSASILAATIFSLKKPGIKAKFAIFFTGLIIIFLANIPRIMLVLAAAQTGLDAELVHTLTWFIMSAIVLIVWYYGTKKIAGIKEFNSLL